MFQSRLVIGFCTSTCLEVNSFTIKLGGRRDRSFNYYRELCKYLFAIAKRCVNAKNLPSEAEFTKILDLPIAEAKALNITEFLSRMKFGAKFDHACKVKADREKHDKKYQGEPIEAVIKAVKEEFGRLARSYLFYLLSETQSLKGLTTNIIRVLCAFDLNTLLVEPLELGKYCIGQLVSSFRLRDYYSPTEESHCLDEYITFVDDLRQRYTSMNQPTFFIFDTIDFLSGQETLQSRPPSTNSSA